MNSTAEMAANALAYRFSIEWEQKQKITETKFNWNEKGSEKRFTFSVVVYLLYESYSPTIRRFRRFICLHTRKHYCSSYHGSHYILSISPERASYCSIGYGARRSMHLYMCIVHSIDVIVFSFGSDARNKGMEGERPQVNAISSFTLISHRHGQAWRSIYETRGRFAGTDQQ